MKKYFFALFCLFFSTFIFSQTIEEHKGIHQIEWENHLNDADQQVLYKSMVITVDSLKERDPNLPELTRAVFGYLPDWNRSSAPPYFDYSVLSHIALFDFTVNTQGDFIGYPAGWTYGWLSTMNKAHQNGVKLIMCVVEFNADVIHELINSTNASQNFYQNVASKIRAYNLDGVNIDFEGPQTEDRGTPMNNFMQGLTHYIKTHVGPEQEISFAGPAVNWAGWDLPGLVDACDYVFIMGYDYYYYESSVTGPSAPITGSSYSLEQTLVNSTNGYGSCDKSKLILGLPYYGNRWRISYEQRTQENASTLKTGSLLIYAQAKDLYKSNRQWSTRYEDSWTYYQVGSAWFQVWCNNAEDLDEKEKLVFEYGLKGTGMWALGYDEEHRDLWHVLINNFLNYKDSLIIDDFENGLGHFNRDPAHGDSDRGISSNSWVDTTSETSFLSEHSLKIVLTDNNVYPDDWKAMLISSDGAPYKNVQLPSNQELCISLKTGQDGLKVAILIDDENGQVEISNKITVIGDNLWHSYAVKLDSPELWESFNNGTGQIDADLVTLNALMFYSAEQRADRVIFLDAVRLLEEYSKPEISTDPIPDARLFLNFPNPFNSTTTFHFTLNAVSFVEILLYDLRGQFIENIYHKTLFKGEHHTSWNGNYLSSGVYIAVLKIEGVVVSTQKLLLVK